jgi:hypothetical protein
MQDGKRRPHNNGFTVDDKFGLQSLPSLAGHFRNAFHCGKKAADRQETQPTRPKTPHQATNPRPRAFGKVNIIPTDIYLRLIRFVQ